MKDVASILYQDHILQGKIMTKSIDLLKMRKCDLVTDAQTVHKLNLRRLGQLRLKTDLGSNTFKSFKKKKKIQLSEGYL